MKNWLKALGWPIGALIVLYIILQYPVILIIAAILTLILLIGETIYNIKRHYDEKDKRRL